MTAPSYGGASAIAAANLGATDFAVPNPAPTGQVGGGKIYVIGWSGAGAVCTWSDQSGKFPTVDASNSANGVGTYVFERIPDGTEGTTFTFRRSSTSNNAGVIAIWVPGAGTTLAAGVTGASATTVVLPDLGNLPAGTYLLQVCLPISVGTFTWTPPGAAVQEAIIVATGTALRPMVGDETLAAAGSPVGTRTWTHTTSTTMRGAIIAIAPTGTAQTASASDTTTSSDSISKKVGKALTDSTTLSDSSARSTGHAVADTVTQSDAVTKAPVRRPADQVTLTDAIGVRAAGKALTDSTALTDARAAAVGRMLGDVTTLTDAQARAVVHVLADQVVLSDATSRAITHQIADAIAFSDSGAQPARGLLGAAADTLTLVDQIAVRLGKHLADTITLIDAATDAETHAYTLALADTLLLTDVASRAISHQLADVVTVADSLTQLLGHTITLADAIDFLDAVHTRVVGPRDITAIGHLDQPARTGSLTTPARTGQVALVSTWAGRLEDA